MSRESFLNSLSNTFKKFPEKPAVIYSSENKHFSISYSSLQTLTQSLHKNLQNVFKNQSTYVTVDISTKLHLLPIFITLWKNNQTINCSKNQQLGKFLITDKTCDHNLIHSFRIMKHRFYVYELSTEFISSLKNDWDICYVLSTSGTTGSPKMVQVPWSCILPNVEELMDMFKICENDVFAWHTPCTFDPFFVEFIGALMHGACLKLDQKYTLTEKFSWNREEETDCPVTVLQTTPSIFMNSSWDFSTLRVLILGGEILPKAFRPPRGVRVFNIYGITEISCWSFIQEIGTDTRYPIGKPLSNIVYKIENDEIFIGSKTRKCLVGSEKPEDLSETVFRCTGDVVEISEEAIFITDRSDNVVKIFGNKLSLTKLYSQLDVLDNYDNHCVVFDQIRRITALFLVDKTLLHTCEKIPSNFLHNFLEPIARPDIVLKIRKFPLTSHGKIDTTVLKKLAGMEILTSHDIQKTFYELWCELLGLEAVTPSATFTECGGDSVTSLKLINRLNAMNFSVPSSLVTKLLGRCSFQECCALLGNANYEDFVNSVDGDFLLEVRWTFNMQKCVDATASFVRIDGVWCVCVGSHSSQISMLECETGRLVWTVYLGDRIESGIAVSADNKRLFTGCYDQHIYCLEAANGQTLWKFLTAGMVKCTPRLSEDGCFIYCGSYDKHFYCLHAENGSIKSSLPVKGSILASPIVTKTRVLFGTLAGEIHAVQIGSLLPVWTQQLNSAIFSSPCLIDNGTKILFAEVEGCVHCYEESSGKPLWTVQSEGNIFSSLTPVTTLDKNFVTFGCHDRHIYRLDVTHEPVITDKLLLDSPIPTAPSIQNQHIACVSSAGFLYILHVQTLKIITRLQIHGETFSSPQWHNSSIFFGSRNDHFICVNLLNKKLNNYLFLLF